MIDELVGWLRGMAVRGVVRRVDDAGQTQRVTVETHRGILRTDVEVLQPYGIAASPPAGAMTVVLAIGADQGDMVALPVACPGRRFGGLAEGEVVLYNAHGTRIALRGGIVEIKAAGEVQITAPTVRITGDLVVTGQVSDAAGSMQEMRDRYNTHNHGGAGPSPIMD